MYLTESYWSYNVKDSILLFHKKLIGTVLSTIASCTVFSKYNYVRIIIQKKVKIDGTEKECSKFGC